MSATGHSEGQNYSNKDNNNNILGPSAFDLWLFWVSDITKLWRKVIISQKVWFDCEVKKIVIVSQKVKRQKVMRQKQLR